jgi:hypothetical protein
MNCPYCLAETIEGRLVCAICSRDIAVPPALLAERDGLKRKRDLIRGELQKAKRELETIHARNKSREG